jgi:excisionase family DNA binding protein
MGKDMASEQMDDMLTVREVAQLLHVHPNTLRRWSNKGRIRAYRISPRGDRRFKREEIARFLAELNDYEGDLKEA